MWAGQFYFVCLIRSQKCLAFAWMNPDFLADGGADFGFNPFDETHANAGEPVGWTDDGMIENGKIVAVNSVPQHDVGTGIGEFVRDAFELVNAVGLLIDGHKERERRRQCFKRRRQVNLVKIIEEHFGGRRTAVHDHQIAFIKCANHGIESARVGQIQKLNVVAVEAFQSGIFIVAITGGKFDVLVFEVLDEVDGKETFADTALAVKNQVEAFSHIVSPGGNSSTLAMRGPRDVNAVVSGVLLAVADVVGNMVLVGAIGEVFGGTEAAARRAGRCLADNLCERFSFKTRRQNRISPDGEAGMPFCMSNSLMAR
jgi:hypothetical protein